MFGKQVFHLHKIFGNHFSSAEKCLEKEYLIMKKSSISKQKMIIKST